MFSYAELFLEVEFFNCIRPKKDIYCVVKDLLKVWVLYSGHNEVRPTSIRSCGSSLWGLVFAFMVEGHTILKTEDVDHDLHHRVLGILFLWVVTRIPIRLKSSQQIKHGLPGEPSQGNLWALCPPDQRRLNWSHCVYLEDKVRDWRRFHKEVKLRADTIWCDEIQATELWILSWVQVVGDSLSRPLAMKITWALHRNLPY